MFIPDPDLDFLPMPDPGVKKAPDLGSGFATLLNVLSPPYLESLSSAPVIQVLSPPISST
jgi:hypothetical protein